MTKHHAEEVSSDFRVGVIMFIALAFLVTALVFAGGEKGILLHKTFRLKAYLPDVGGLKKGCAVTMGGMAIGEVIKVDFAVSREPNPIEVTMEVRLDLKDRIKKDSIPAVRTQGMLGDRYLDISMGGPGSESLDETGYLVGEATSNFDTTVNRATAVLEHTQKLLDAVNKRQGTVGHFFYDETLYTTLVKATEDLNALIRDVKENPKRYLKFSVF